MAQEFNLFEAEDRLAQECRVLLDGGNLPGETAAKSGGRNRVEARERES